MAHSATATAPILYGIVAEYNDTDEIIAAAKKVREAGYRKMDGYTPFPVHGLDEAIGFEDYKVKWAIFFGGAMGLIAGFGLEYWVSVYAYPLNIGGRPKFSWPSFIPVAYECTILFASLTAVVGMLAFNGLPRPNHPIFNARNFTTASQNRFFLCIEAEDEQFDADRVKELLRSTGANDVSEVYADEEGWD